MEQQPTDASQTALKETSAETKNGKKEVFLRLLSSVLHMKGRKIHMQIWENSAIWVTLNFLC